MRRFPSSWDKTLAALGFRRKVKRIKREFHRRNGAWLESLERREMLAGDTPVPIRPEYVLVGQAEDTGRSPFVVSTEYAPDGAPTAVVALDEGLGSADDGVHELNLELRLGDTVLETQQLAINLAGEEFSDAFYRDRIQLVHGLVRSATIEELEAWRDELGPDGVFTSVGGSIEVSESDDALLESSQRLAAMAAYHREFSGLLSGVDDRRDFYEGVLRVTGAMGSIEDPERAEAIRNELGRVALMMGKQLGYDLPHGEALTTEATTARDAMLEVVSPYYTVLGPYGLNTELVHSAGGSLATNAVAVVEQGVFELDDKLRVELGTHNAFVGATITSNGQAAVTAPLLPTVINGSNAIDATWVPGISGALWNSSTFTATTNGNGEATHLGLVAFDLSSAQGNVPESATLTLTKSSGDGEAPMLRTAVDAWYDQLDEDYSWGDGALKYHNATIPSESTVAGVYTFDVTETVQRSLLLGDANADGLVDHDYQGTLQRRELAADVNAAYLAIRDWDRYREKYAGLEIVPGDLLYRVDANWDGVTSAVDGRILLDRLGVAGGDFDLDGDVDVADLAAYQANYGKVAQTFADGDADFNGFVNAYDYDIWDAFDASALSYKHAMPHFEISLPETGSLDFDAANDGPKLDLNYSADVEITDVHAYAVDPTSGNATGQVVVEYRALHEDLPAGMQTQLMRVPADGGPLEPLPTSLQTLPAATLASGVNSYAFDVSDVADLEEGDRLAVQVWSETPGVEFSHTRLLSEGIVFDSSTDKVYLFGGMDPDRVLVDQASITMPSTASRPTLSLLASTFALTQFGVVSMALGGGDDSVDVRRAFSGQLRLDGGAGDDHYEIEVGPGQLADVIISDSQGVNSLEFEEVYYRDLVFPGGPITRSNGKQTGQIEYYHTNPYTSAVQTGPAGAYSITLENPHAIQEIVGSPGAFESLDTLLVDTLTDLDNDDFSRGDLSLREALRLADLLPGEQTIEFDPGLFGASRSTLQLTNGSAGSSDYIPHSHWGSYAPEADEPQPLTIRSEVQINGPGADLLEISGGGETQVIAIEEQAGLDIAIRDIAVADGYFAGTSRSPSINAFGSDLLLERVEVYGGYAPYAYAAGGAVFSRDADLTIRDSYFHHNTAYHGGGVYFQSDSLGNRLEISGTTISNNTAVSLGGGISIAGTNAEVEIVNSTISANDSGQNGGGIWIDATGSTATIGSSTIYGNTTKYSGGGVRVQTGTQVAMHNTLVAFNRSENFWWVHELSVAFDASSSNNLVQHANSASGLSPSKNTLGVIDPLIEPLSQNGGFAPTHAIGIGSVAVDGGDSTLSDGLTHDQRGGSYGRERGVAQDIGAYESAFEEANVGNEDVLVIHGTDLADQIIVAPGVVYLGGLNGTPIPFDQNGLPLHVHGGQGNDTITLMPGVENVTLFGDEGDDLLFGASGADKLYGGAGEDQLYGRGGDDQLFGDEGEDVLYGGDGGDELYGGEQDDKLLAGAGDDSLHGNAGDDHLDAGTGTDTLFGGAGHDHLVVGNETVPTLDTLYGDLDDAEDAAPVAGDDRYVLPGTANLTFLSSSGGEDTIDVSHWEQGARIDLSEAAAQEMTHDASGSLLLIASGGITRVIGTDHDDTLIGSASRETLEGRGGNDKLIGGGGNDHLLGGFGDDELLGWDSDGVTPVIADGGYGDDTYWITDAIAADTTVKLRDAEGENDAIKAGALGADDAIGVATWSSAQGVTIDLSDNLPQLVYDNGVHSFTLDLPGEEVIEHVVGTDEADTLTGNTLVNTLDGLLGANRFVYEEGVDTQLGELAEETPQLTIAAPRVWDGTASLSLAIDQGAPSQGVIQTVEALGPLASSVSLSGTGATRSATLIGVHPNGVYPLTLRVTAADGRVGIVMVDVTIGAVTPTTPSITAPSQAIPDAADPRTYTYAFTVTGTDQVRLAGELPASLQAAYDDDPDSVLYETSTPGEWELRWATKLEDQGEHQFRIEATDASPIPHRYSLPVVLAVPEYNEPARVKRVATNGPFAVDFAYAPTATGSVDHRSDPSFNVTLVNDDGFDNVRVLVDWTYDETAGFSADQTLYGRDEETEGEEWSKLISPNSHSYFTDAVANGADTQVAFRVEEYKPDDVGAGIDGYVPVTYEVDDPVNSGQTITKEVYSTNSADNPLAYRPVATESLEFSSWGLSGAVPYDPTNGYSSTDITIVGSLTNENSSSLAVGTLEGLAVNFYKVGTSEEWIGSATTDENGSFEFTARDAFTSAQLADFSQNHTVTIRAKVQDPSPVLSPGTGILATDDGGNANIAGETFTLEAPSAPAFDEIAGVGSGVYLSYDDTPRLEGLGFVRQPKITGKITSANVPVEGLTVLFDLGSESVGESIAIADANGDFTFLPPIALDATYNRTITAEIVTWDGFRRQPLDTQSRDITIDPNDSTYQPGAYEAPAINGFANDGSAYVPVVSGQFTVGAENRSRILVEFSKESTFDAILAETLTELDGSFEHRFEDLSPGEHTIYARSVGWNHWADLGSELVSGPVSSTTVTISGTAPAPTLTSLSLANDTGVDGDWQSADPTFEGIVDYGGDIFDVQVEFDLNGDGRADQIVFPEEDGSFRFTPSGLIPGEQLSITAWAIAPDFGGDLGFDLDPALQEVLDDGPIYGPADNEGLNTIGWSDEQLDESAQAWFDELFLSDAKFGGDWYDANFTPDWRREQRSNEISQTLTFLDPANLGYSIGNVTTSGGTTFSGQVVSEGEVQGLRIEVYLNRGDSITPDWELDGQTQTDSAGAFSYTPHALSKPGDNLKLVLHQPVYDDPFTTVLQEVFLDPYGGADVAHDAALDTITLIADSAAGLVDHNTTAPIFRDRIALDSNPDFNPAGWIVEFDTDVDGRTDASTLTDAEGYYQLDFTDWLDLGPVLLSVRVAQNAWNDQAGATHLTHGAWVPTTAWASNANAAPEIARFELLNDTGVSSSAPNDRVLDRVTTDPTVVGRVVEAAPYSTVEFSHRGDGVVDGAATTDASGRFEYLPQDLTLGFWDLRARVIETNQLTGVEQSSGWQPITATGNPQEPGAAVGFELIDPSAATVEEFSLLSAVPGSDVPTGDSRLHIKVSDADTLENVAVDIYELRDADGGGVNDDRVLIATTTLEPDGTAQLVPVGVTLNANVTLIAVPRELNPYTGLPVATLPAGDPNANEAEITVTFAASTSSPTIGRLHTDPAAVIDPTMYGELTVPTTTVANADVPDFAPVEVVLQVTYVTEVSQGVDDREVVYESVPYQVGSDGVYRYAFTPDLSRWPDGIPANDSIELRARGVAIKDGAQVLSNWNGLQTVSGSLLNGFSRPAAELTIETRFDNGNTAPLDATTSGQQTLSALMSSSIVTTLETLGGGEEVRVEGRYIEISTASTTAEAVTEFTVPLDDQGLVDLSEYDLGYGEITLQIRLVEEAVVDKQWPDGQEHLDAFESSLPQRIAGEWETIKFTLIDSVPAIEAASLTLVDGHTPEGSSVPEAVDPVVSGNITSAIYEADDLGGLTVEYDLNDDGLSDGSTLTYADGAFDFRPNLLTTGVHTIDVRVVDPYGGEEPLESGWESFTFRRASVQAPGFKSTALPALEVGSFTNDVVNGDVTQTPVITGQVDVGDTLLLGLSDLTVEFDLTGDGNANDSAPVDVTDPANAGFSYDASDLAYGESSVRVRTAGWNGIERVYGEWADPIEFFHRSPDAPSVAIDALPIDFDTTGAFSGRATIGGFGAEMTIEVVTISGAVGSEVKHTNYARADENGLFTIVSPRLRNGVDGTHTILVRGVTSLGGESVPGLWNQVSGLPTFDLPTPQTPVWEVGSFQAAYPATLVTGAYGDPTVKGNLSDHHAGAVIEIDYDSDGVVDATATLDGDGAFLHTPVGLTANQAYAMRARWSRWNPETGQQAQSSWESLAGGTLTFDPTVGGAPQVSDLQLQQFDLDTMPTATELTPFVGQVIGNGHLGDLTVWFDHDGDDVPEGKAYTRPDGRFTYYAKGVNTGGGTQTIDAWVNPPEYSLVPATAAYTLDFTLSKAPSIASVVYRVDPLERITGQVGWDGERATEVEYWFPRTATSAAWSDLTSADLSNAELGFQRASVTQEGRFFFDVPAGATTVLVRAVAGDSVGRWKQLDLAVSTSEHALPIGQVAPLYPDITNGNQSADPTLLGKVGDGGQGAFATVEVLQQDLSGYVPIARVNADAKGEFRYTLPSDANYSTPYDLRFRTVVWDEDTESETRGEPTDFTFTWVASSPVVTMDWSQANTGTIEDPTVVGSVSGVGRQAGIRIEFNHGSGESVDGFAYTDANGEFRYTPIGLDRLANTTLEITARAVVWDEYPSSQPPDFADHATEDSVDRVSATLASEAPASISPQEFTDLTNDEVALAALKDAVFASLEDLGFAGDATGTLDAGFGDVALLHQGGGDENFETPAFTPATGSYSVPVSSSSDSDYHLITADGVLSGSYVITVATTDQGSDGDIDSASEISFELTIDSYSTHRDQNTSADPGLYDQTSTQLELSGVYKFTFSTAADAVYAGSDLSELDHYITEEVDYDYAIFDSAATDNVVNSGRLPIDSRSVATGGSEYTLRLGDAGQSDPASFSSSAANDYSASISHEETTRIDGYGDATGSVNENSDSGVTVDRTYVETVTKSGSFAGADSPSGTISVTIFETIVTTTDTETRVSQGGEQSYESVDGTEVVTRTYSGSATYTGSSVSGSGALTETTTYEIEVSGGGMSMTGDQAATHQNDRWEYEGEASGFSTFTIGGGFSESLDPSSPSETSDYAGSHSSGSSSKWEGKFTTYGKTYSGDDQVASTDVGGGERLNRTTSSSGEFSGNSRNGTSHLGGEYNTFGFVYVKEWAEGRVTESPEGRSNTTDFRSLTFGDATITSDVQYSSDFSPESGDVRRENIDYDVTVTGDTLYAGQSRGTEDLGEGQGNLGYFSRITSEATLEVESKGQATTGRGSLDDAAFEPSDSGQSKLDSYGKVKTLNAAWTRDSAGTTISKVTDDYEQLTFYDGQQSETSFKGIVTTSHRDMDAAYVGTLPEEHEPGTFPEEPTEEDFDGTFIGSRLGSDVKTTTFGSFSSGGPEGYTEDVTVHVVDNRGGKTKNVVGHGPSGSNSYETDSDFEDDSNGGRSSGSGGLSGGSHDDSSGGGDSSAKSESKSRYDDGPNRSSSSAKNRTALISDYSGGQTNGIAASGHNNRSSDGNHSGKGFNSSTSESGGLVSGGSSSGKSSGKSDAYSNTNGRPSDANSSYGQNGEGNSNSTTTSTQSGPGFTSSASTTTDNSGKSGSDGSASIADNGIRPDGDRWYSNSDGKTTTEWESESYGDNSYSKTDGDTTANGDRNDSGGADPDGSDSTSRRSSDGESNNKVDQRSVSTAPDGTTTTIVIDRDHEAKGDGSVNTSSEDGRTTSAGGSLNDDSENKTTVTTDTKGPKGTTHREDKYTSKSTLNDDSTSNTNTHKWNGNDDLSWTDSHAYRSSSYTALSKVTKKSDYEGNESETITTSDKEESAIIKRDSESNSKTTYTHKSDDWDFRHTFETDEKSDSKYDSKHGFGDYGVTGGSISGNSNSEVTVTDTLVMNENYDDSQFHTTEKRTGTTTNKSNESGSYSDTTDGRTQSGSYDTKSKSTSNYDYYHTDTFLGVTSTNEQKESTTKRDGSYGENNSSKTESTSTYDRSVDNNVTGAAGPDVEDYLIEEIHYKIVNGALTESDYYEELTYGGTGPFITDSGAETEESAGPQTTSSSGSAKSDGIQLSSNWAIAGLQGAFYGGVEIANSATQAISLGYADLNDTADYYGGNLLSETDRRLTKLGATAVANAGLALATGGAAAGASRLASTRLGQAIATSRTGQALGRAANAAAMSSRLQTAARLGAGAMTVNQGLNAARNGASAVQAAANGEFLDALEHTIVAIENGAGAFGGAKGLFGKPVVANAKRVPGAGNNGACFVAGTTALVVTGPRATAGAAGSVHLASMSTKAGINHWMLVGVGLAISAGFLAVEATKRPEKKSTAKAREQAFALLDD